MGVDLGKSHRKRWIGESHTGRKEQLLGNSQAVNYRREQRKAGGEVEEVGCDAQCAGVFL